MRVCMFHPLDHPMERGWVGRIDDGQVVHLAAQTLQSFFTGGGSAREHAAYAHSEVQLLAPVLHPPAVRVFDGAGSFAFANPAAIVGPGEQIPVSPSGRVLLVPRLVAVIGAEEEVAGFTTFAEWRDPARARAEGPRLRAGSRAERLHRGRARSRGSRCDRPCRRTTSRHGRLRGVRLARGIGVRRRAHGAQARRPGRRPGARCRRGRRG